MIGKEITLKVVGSK